MVGHFVDLGKLVYRHGDKFESKSKEQFKYSRNKKGDFEVSETVLRFGVIKDNSQNGTLKRDPKTELKTKFLDPPFPRIQPKKSLPISQIF